MTTHQSNSPTTVVLGGTGKTGRRVVERLRARGLPVRAASRSATPPFDWEDESTWASALTGASAAYLAYSPDITIPGAAETVGAVADLAVRSGVRRLVLLSGRGEESALPTERAFMDSGAEWTLVRSSWFYQNFSEAFFLDPVLSGHVMLPAGDVAEPFADVDDVADVVVAALTEDGHAGQVYEITGPRLLSFPKVVAEIAAASGRDVRYTQISVDDFAAGLAAEGVPDLDAGIITDLFANVLDGRNSFVTDDVERVLGRPANDFTDYARAAAATGVWAAREPIDQEGSTVA